MDLKPKIIQTPTHMHLFERVTPYKKNNDYRDSLRNNCDMSKLANQYFNENNVSNLDNKLKQQTSSKYKYTVRQDSENITQIIMKDIYENACKANKIVDVATLNDLTIRNGLDSYYKHVVGQENFLRDRDMRGNFLAKPIITSAKRDKQLPQFSFL